LKIDQTKFEQDDKGTV